MTFAHYVPKIDPTRRPPRVEESGFMHVAGSNNPALSEWETAGLAEPDLDVMRAYRLERIRQQLRQHDVAGCLLYDPLNTRYALESTNMQIWAMHNPVRYAFIATDGPAILFDYHSCRHISEGFTLIDEIRPATSYFYFSSGQREHEHSMRWADEIVDLIQQYGSGNRRILVDKCEPIGIWALQERGIEVDQTQSFTEEARKIKHEEELKAMRRAVHACETGMWAMWEALEPGMTENELWAELHKANIARGGEWIETRLLASGWRTNPWFYECSDKVIEKGEIVAFDTDLIGPYGYCCDISRTWVAGVDKADPEQNMLLEIALEQIATNIDMFRPGMSFRELSEKGYRLPEDCRAGRYGVVLHGVGLCDEYPSVKYPEDWEKSGYDGIFEPGMVICFESYVGRTGGREGVKIERQAVVTETGIDLMDVFPLGFFPS
ncbi:MAG: Xaa-Pro peptidase family protein [Pseudomonadota bacterium]